MANDFRLTENHIIWIAQEHENREYWARKTHSKNYGSLITENQFVAYIFLAMFVENNV